MLKPWMRGILDGEEAVKSGPDRRQTVEDGGCALSRHIGRGGNWAAVHAHLWLETECPFMLISHWKDSESLGFSELL